MSNIEFKRGKDKKKRKRRGFGAARKAYAAGKEGGRMNASFEGVGGMLKDAVGAGRSKELNRRQKGAVIGGAVGYAQGTLEGKGGKAMSSLKERGSAALGKAKDYLGKARNAAGELTGKARNAVASGYSSVKEKAQDVLRKRRKGAEAYARAVEALEFETAKQVGILEFATGRNYIEFARTPGARDKQKRKKKGWSTAQKVGAGLAGAAAIGATARYGGAALRTKMAQRGLSRAPKSQAEAMNWKPTYKSQAAEAAARGRAASGGARGQLKRDVEAVKSGFGWVNKKRKQAGNAIELRTKGQRQLSLFD